MKIAHTHCAGLDVHKKQVTVCVLVGEAADEPARHLRTFRTVTESDTRTPPRTSGVPFSRESRRGRLRVCATVQARGDLLI